MKSYSYSVTDNHLEKQTEKTPNAVFSSLHSY